jgi:hypothetical protein
VSKGRTEEGRAIILCRLAETDAPFWRAVSQFEILCVSSACLASLRLMFCCNTHRRDAEVAEISQRKN